MSDDELDLLAEYREFHDGLNDMIASGRLNESAIPDDYAWLISTLADIAKLRKKVDDFLAWESGDNEEDEHDGEKPSPLG